MWFNRLIAVQVSRLARTFPAVVLTGARQAGKTSLLKELFPRNNFVSLDLPSNAEMAETAPEAFLDRYSPPVTIDEVQYAPSLFRYLKKRIDEKRHDYGQYILTGSQKFTLMRSISESLAGRCGVCELETLGLKEIRQHRELPLEQVIVLGGYPELHARSDLQRDDFYSGYLATYLERDVRSLLRVNELRDFQRFLRACALRSGGLLNKSELARDVGISAPTASEWLSVLHASNQVLLLEPWFSNKTKSIVKSPKLYLADSGLLCYLVNISSTADLLSSPMLGNIWETFVYSELRKQEEKTGEIWFWRDRHGLEVDFLKHRGGKFTLIEAKWSEHPGLKDAKSIDSVGTILGRGNILDARLISRTKNNYRLNAPGGLTVSVESL
jgi:predicted AAA+ superfamily ATPase